ncbi:MAG: bacillithiol biosynthesis deacetylase BshB1 [Thermoanaerobaculia bacterium]
MQVDVLAIGAHPDDVELGCGGTLAKLVMAGRRVGILHLSCGEAGTRGSVEERRREAEAAAEALGASALEILDCGDGSLRYGSAEEDALIAILRRLRPELVFAPTPADRHPDHGRAHQLVAASCFYAGLARRGAGGTPHRPAAVFSYMQNDPIEVAFVVDVTEAWPRKMASLDAYRSQIHQPGQERRGEPMTKVASEEFRAAVEGRARHFGILIGAALGEPFGSRLPLAVADPMTLLPGGLR